MALDVEQGRRMLQLLTSRYDDRHWRKKIEKTLSLPATGVGDDKQRALFVYLREKLKAYKSRRADPDSWMVGGYVTKEVIDRAKVNPAVVGSPLTKEDVSFLGEDPGSEVDHDWWEEMLVWWFEAPEAEEGEEGAEGEKTDEEADKAETSAADRSGQQSEG